MLHGCVPSVAFSVKFSILMDVVDIAKIVGQ